MQADKRTWLHRMSSSMTTHVIRCRHSATAGCCAKFNAWISWIVQSNFMSTATPFLLSASLNTYRLSNTRAFGMRKPFHWPVASYFWGFSLTAIKYCCRHEITIILFSMAMHISRVPLPDSGSALPLHSKGTRYSINSHINKGTKTWIMSPLFSMLLSQRSFLADCVGADSVFPCFLKERVRPACKSASSASVCCCKNFHCMRVHAIGVLLCKYLFWKIRAALYCWRMFEVLTCWNSDLRSQCICPLVLTLAIRIQSFGTFDSFDICRALTYFEQTFRGKVEKGKLIKDVPLMLKCKRKRGRTGKMRREQSKRTRCWKREKGEEREKLSEGESW